MLQFLTKFLMHGRQLISVTRILMKEERRARSNRGKKVRKERMK